MTCTLSEYMSKKFNILYSDNKEFLMNVYTRQSASRLKLNASTIFSKKAGLSYSKFLFNKH